MKNKKAAAQQHRKRKSHQRIILYLQNKWKAEQEYGQTLEEYLSSWNVDVCFRNIHTLLDKNMIYEEKKGIYLQDGVYILLQGSVIYLWSKNKHDRDKKDHLLALAKAGSFSNLNINSLQRQNLLINGYSILINSNFAVLQAQSCNIITNQQSCLIKIDQKTLLQADFQKLRQQRLNLFSKIKLPGIQNSLSQPLVTFNSNLLHTFRLRVINFHHRFRVETLGIVFKGTATIINNNLRKKIAFSQYCVLLPNIQYEVCTSQMVIIQLIKNPTINFANPALIAQFLDQIVTKYLPQQRNEKKQKIQLQIYRKKISNSISSSSIKYKGQKLSKYQQSQKKKELNTFSKQCQNYCIISMQFCKENLSQIKNMKKRIYESEQHQRQRQKDKRPQILFNMNRKQNCSLHRQSQNAKYLQNSMTIKHNPSFSNSKNNLMDRYEIYSKQLYGQFQKYLDLRQQKGLGNSKKINLATTLRS